ncbi:MAG: TIGR04348 family glycosyltransferase [Planctomycetes bacterium]|nr:TIGR04348 family glycosyltransferase [Planctomycetota bacterium]MCB9904449.1 TIGR04348 family glycosyltransferase [Planctomycetota bacterium]
MRVQIVTPAPRASRSGNRLTALRWAGQLRSLGHRVRVREALDDAPADLLIALHAEKSASSLAAWKTRRASAPAVLIMTGTDLYDHDRLSQVALESCARADRIVVLQPGAIERIPSELRGRVRCIPQSALPPRELPSRDNDRFEVVSLAHLRPVKDPLLLARAAALVPANSRLRVRLAGSAYDAALADAVRRESLEHPRFEWVGSLSRTEAMRLLASADLLVITSRNEGGPAVVPEAIACGVGILSTEMPAARSLLGADHPGLFPVGDSAALAELLHRAEADPQFLHRLTQRSLDAQPEVDPSRERGRIAALLSELPR